MSHPSPEPKKPNSKRLLARTQGKDELNLCDWRISVPTFQQPRVVQEGGRLLDEYSYTITRAKAPDQRVTLRAPSAIGLPTALEEDILLALIALHKTKDNFTTDTLHFHPSELFEILRWKSDKGENYNRIEEALERLTALYMRFEHTWYDKLTQTVQPILMTGIISEAELVRSRSVKRNTSAQPQSYIQWRKTFYESLSSGNLTDLNLDLYFSFRRPGSKQLYRHLNKRFYGKRRNQSYERDLRDLACGHLGMTDNKDLKRNFHRLVTELESSGFLPERDQADRYHKVRPGVYRVRFDPPAASVKPKAAAVAAAERGVSAEHKLVCEFHRLYSGREQCRPAKAELEHAGALLAEHGEAFIFKVLPKVVVAMQGAGFGDAKYFGAAMRFFDTTIESFARETRDRERERERREQASLETNEREAEASRRRQRFDQLRTQFLRLPESERCRLQDRVLERTTPFLRDHIRKNGIDQDVAVDVLEEFARESTAATS